MPSSSSANQPPSVYKQGWKTESTVYSGKGHHSFLSIVPAFRDATHICRFQEGLTNQVLYMLLRLVSRYRSNIHHNGSRDAQYQPKMQVCAQASRDLQNRLMEENKVPELPQKFINFAVCTCIITMHLWKKCSSCLFASYTYLLAYTLASSDAYKTLRNNMVEQQAQCAQCIVENKFNQENFTASPKHMHE